MSVPPAQTRAQSTTPAALPPHLLPLAKIGSKEKASEEPDSYDGVCFPAVLTRLPWWE